MGLLMKFFKKNVFKDWQLRAIKAVLGGKNALIVQPTGSGKSLCFQFPCTITGRGRRIMLENLPIMLCCTAPKMYLLCSTNAPIMLDKLSTKQLS